MLADLSVLEKVLSAAFFIITSGTSWYFKQHATATIKQNTKIEDLEQKCADLHTDISVLEATTIKRVELEQIIRDLESKMDTKFDALSEKLDRQQERLIRLLSNSGN